MSSYTNITLDTTGPAGVSVSINDGEERTCEKQFALKILCSDSDTTDYQMKIWSEVMEFSTEESAQWEDFSSEKTIEFFNDIYEDKTVAVYVKLRDELWNESEIAYDDIEVYIENPTVNITSVSRTKISKIPATDTDSEADKLFPKNSSLVTFYVDKECDELMVMVVQDINATYDDSENVLIPTSGSSNIQNTQSDILTDSDGMYVDTVFASGHYRAYIKGADLESASPGDGIKIIKIFTHSTEGKWSA